VGSCKLLFLLSRPFTLHQVIFLTRIQPAVTPALVALRRTSFLPRFHQSYPEYLHSVWIQSAVGAFSILALLPSLDYGTLAFSLFPILGLVGLYTTLIRIYELDIDLTTGAVQLGLGEIVRAITIRALPMLVFLALALAYPLMPGPTFSFLSVLLAGIMKAIYWSLLLWVAQQAPWEIATTIGTCVVSAASAFSADSTGSLGLLQTLTRLGIGLGAIYQTISLLPKQSRGRYLLFIFALWPMLSLISHTPLSERIPFIPGEIWTEKGPTSTPVKDPRHPIEILITKAQTDFTQLIEGQSKVLEDAEAEYRRRYSRDPPPGFDKWFSYATSKQSVLIDDFDMIHEDLKPFWKISPEILHQSIDHVSSFDHLALRKCGFTKGEYHGQGGGWIVDDLGSLLSDVAKDLPDVDFAFDVVDEPREIISQQILDAGGEVKPEFDNANHQSIWERVISPCQTEAARTTQSSIHDYGIPFVQNWYDAKDVCQHPEFEFTHGFFASPETCILTGAPVPILTQAAPTSFGDIMYPSPWYTAKYAQQVYQDDQDPPWEQKANTLYWAGSTTGSHSTNGSWKYSHRQRFVQLIQTLPNTTHKYLEEVRPGTWEARDSAKDLHELFDVKLTAVIQCDEKDCEEQKEYFTLGDHEERSQQFQSRFIFDADGNAFSGRYYTLLQSRSVVLKQTVLREWHDERLVPWVHYVPISLGMEELPEVMRYLTSEGGTQWAKEIANAGREWQAKALRREEFTIYLYRLMLELARIMDPNRKVE
jgi:hypothetical protein